MAYLASTSINGSLGVTLGGMTITGLSRTVSYTNALTGTPGIAVRNYSGVSYSLNIYCNGMQAMNSTNASPVYLNTSVGGNVSFWSNTYINNANGFYQKGYLALTTSTNSGAVNTTHNPSSAYLLAVSSANIGTNQYGYKLERFYLTSSGTLCNRSATVSYPYPCYAKVGTMNYSIRFNTYNGTTTYNYFGGATGNYSSFATLTIHSSYANAAQTNYSYVQSWVYPTGTAYFPSTTYLNFQNVIGKAFYFSVPTLLTVFGPRPIKFICKWKIWGNIGNSN